MNSSGPVAIVYGIEKFGAKFLVKELLLKDIYVVGVGEYVSGIEENDNFRWVAGRGDYEGKVNYVFDFEGDKNIFDLVLKNSAKLTEICINDQKKAERIKNDLIGANINWRLIDARGVYGPGMADDGGGRTGINFLVEAVSGAVKNENLVLPALGTKFRLLNIVDLTEVVLRASFLSGTEKEEYVIFGNESDSGEVAKVLIDEAKMTKFKVVQKDYKFETPGKYEIEENWRKLRWHPGVEFREGVVETLQYFFSVIDEESRKKMKEGSKANKSKSLKVQKSESQKIKKEKNLSRFEVMVEEEKTNYELPITHPGGQANYELEKDKKETVRKNEVSREAEERKAEKYKKEIEEEFKRAKEKEEEKKAKEEIIYSEEIKSLAKQYTQTTPLERDEVIEEDEERIEIKNELKDGPARLGGLIGRQVESSKTREKKGGTGIINFKKIGFLVMIILGLGMFSIPVGWGIKVVAGIKNISKIREYIEEEKYAEADKKAETTIAGLKKIDNQIDDWGLNRMKTFRNLQTGLKVEEGVLVIEKKAIPIAEAMEKVSGAIFDDKEISWESELEVLNKGMVEVDTEIGLLQARLNGDWNWLPARFRPEVQKGIKSLNMARSVIGTSRKGLNILKEFLGSDGKRREYLVLFQNENELRAGGGFIGSWGMLSFEGGKLLNLDIRDVYEADGQLKGHVEPPAEIKQYLGEAGWFLRDSNWKVDFVDANKDIEWFLEKETGRKVDGVIGINLAVAKAILDVTGPIYVVDFGEKIGKDNLYEQAQFYAENKFFPGSKQKASFLGGLGRQLFEEIRNLDSKKMLELYLQILEQFDKNEIQLVMHEKQAAKIAADLGWDGAIYQGKCLTDRCYADYLYLSESNFGVNKANYYIYRGIEQTVDITQMAISRVLKINYENTAKNKSWPGGDYKNYLRVYIPQDTNLAEVSISDSAQPGKKSVVGAGEMKISQIYNKKEIGFLVPVPVGQKRTVEIRYVSKIDLGIKDKFSYLGYIQKQSGYGDTGFVSLVSFPLGWQPIQVQPAANMVNNKLLFNTKLDMDIKMGVELGR
ncbi:MAG: DUF4012 domain-containing protein [Candidatus Shapirobacteria bacterium]|jgi:hypothetical protein